MKISDTIQCRDFPCLDVKRRSAMIPDIAVNPGKISIMMISEAAPQKASDYYYRGRDSLFEQTTVLAFQDAGAAVASMQDLLKLGVYCTTAVKCAKVASGISAATIERCSHLLEEEIARFPNVRVYLLMGDVAIKAVNLIAKREGQPRVIPAGSTYKIRGGEFTFRGRRVFPSYVQAGPAFFVEKSKRRMIAEDIAQALKIVGAA